MVSKKANRAPMTRSEVMARVRSTGSRPEMAVRRLVHSLGYRYRLHDKGLPGTPDLVFRPVRKTIFVHGCFWHGHDCKLGNRRPKTRTDFWNPKIDRNIQRDAETIRALDDAGWSSLVIWECQTRDLDGLRERIVPFLGAREVDGGARPKGDAWGNEASR